MFRDLVIANRSVRRFVESEAISRQTLLELIDLARLSPSGANKQALRYYVSCDRAQNERVFEALAWAAYFKDWAGPVSGERPSGYIVIVQDQANWADGMHGIIPILVIDVIVAIVCRFGHRHSSASSQINNAN